MKTIVVSRHKEFIELLKELNEIDDTNVILDHATVEDVKDKIVIGILPIDLASAAIEIRYPVWNIPLEARGREWSMEETKRFFGGLKNYRVFEVEVIK